MSDEETAAQHCIALSPLGTSLLFTDSPQSPQASPSSSDTATLCRFRSRQDTITKKAPPPTSSTDKEPTPSPPAPSKPISLTIYAILSQSQPKFTLVKSRELTLPHQEASLGAVTVVTASISLHDSLIAVGLTNGRIWIFSLDEIAWVTCIASAVSLMTDPIFAAPMSTRTPRPRFECSPLDLISVSIARLFDN